MGERARDCRTCATTLATSTVLLPLQTQARGTQLPLLKPFRYGIVLLLALLSTLPTLRAGSIGLARRDPPLQEEGVQFGGNGGSTGTICIHFSTGLSPGEKIEAVQRGFIDELCPLGEEARIHNHAVTRFITCANACAMLHNVEPARPHMFHFAFSHARTHALFSG